MAAPRIGIIGGSGIQDFEGLSEVERIEVATPFGAPSAPLIIGTLEGARVAFLTRHGTGHVLLPGEVPYRANICAFKMLGVERILSCGAVGSMKESIHQMDVVIPDQFIDRTTGRASTFFGDGIVAHLGLAEPTCEELRPVLLEAGDAIGLHMHPSGTYLCIDGPAFSTIAESRLYRQWGVDVIGMTNATEAKLAREAELCYATIALVSDYDCWHQEHENVSVEMVIEWLRKNAVNAKHLICNAVRQIAAARSCTCGEALRGAILTDPAQIPATTRERLRPIVGKYVG